MNIRNRRLFAGMVSGIVAGALSLGLLGTATARETPETPETRPRARETRQGMRGHRGRMVKDLNLTAAQKAQLKALREEAKQRRQAMTQNGSLSDADKRTQVRTMRAEYREKFLAVLTPEQREKLKAQRSQMKSRRGARGAKSAAR